MGEEHENDCIQVQLGGSLIGNVMIFLRFFKFTSVQVTRIGLSLCVSYQWGTEESEVNSTSFLLMGHSWSPRRDRSLSLDLLFKDRNQCRAPWVHKGWTSFQS